MDANCKLCALALMPLLWASAIPVSVGVEPAGDRRAPVDDARQIAEKNNHARPDAAEKQQPLDWSMMKAWNQGASDLSQTAHRITPAGKSLRVPGRVLSLAAAQGGRFLIVKSEANLTVVDADAFKVLKQYPFPTQKSGKKDRGSMYGLAVAADGATVYFTGNTQFLHRATVDAEGALTFGLPIELSRTGKPVDPLGVALSPDGKFAAVALAFPNELAIVDLPAGAVSARIPVGVCPYGVVITPDGKQALVSNFGGSPARSGDRTEKSAGVDVVVDERGVALRGTVSVIDLVVGKTVKEIETGIHPEAMTLSPDGKLAYVVDASGDGVSVIDIARQTVVKKLCTRPRADLPYGSLTDGLAISPDGKTLYAANAGNNAVAVFDLNQPSEVPRGLIAAGGFPGSVCLCGENLFIGNVYGYFGGLQKVALPADPVEQRKMTRVAEEGFHLAEIVRAAEQLQTGVPPRPVPAQVGEPSSVKHVVYIIKENKKFDPVLGDIGRGNCDPRLCEFPRHTTPNAHAIVDQFVLLDNYYCSGVNSSDGHQWAVQGVTSPYHEKDWADARCTYDFGVDPLCYAGCGFIWDHLLRHGISFRNFGELDYPVKTQPYQWSDYYRTWKSKSGKAPFKCVYYLESLRRYSDLRYPGWEMEIPDQVRADVFLEALAEFEKAGKMPEFMIVYLPDDHTAGGGRNVPTPRAYVADNDLAMGRVIEGLSKSRFWKDTAIFVNEDDPQGGADHVDGHRSICLVAGPYVKRGGTVVSRFYNQASVLHTICRIFGVPPMNQTVAMAPVMEDCFQDTPDFTPYICVPANVALDEMNAPRGRERSKATAALAPLTEKLDFTKPDQNDRDAEMYSRFVWSTVRGDERFPVEYTGAHGKGLKALGLRLEARVEKDDDDR
jgi:hypothetical protein